MMMSAGPSSTRARLHHPNERLMVMSAASLAAKAPIFNDDASGASLHERAAAPPERASDDDVGGGFDGQGGDF